MIIYELMKEYDKERGKARQFLTLNGDDELGNNRKHLSATLVEHIENSLDGKESVWVLLLSNSLEEDGQIVMVIQLLDFNLPVDAVLGTMLNGNGEITSVIEASEFT